MHSQQGTSCPWPQIFEHFSRCQTICTKYIQLKKYLTYFLGSTAVFTSRYVYCSVCKLLKAQNVPSRPWNARHFPREILNIFHAFVWRFTTQLWDHLVWTNFIHTRDNISTKSCFFIYFFYIMSAVRVKNRFNCESQHQCVSGGAGEDKRKKEKTRCVC